MLDSVFEGIPSSGFLPVRVKITNSTNRDRVWHIDANGRQYGAPLAIDSTFNLPCKAASSVTHTILVPLAADNANNRTVVFVIREDSLGRRNENHYGPCAYNLPSIGISKKLSDDYLTKLQDQLQKSKGGSSNEFFAHTFTPADLPADWRAFSGFDSLIFSLPEWTTLRPGVRQAILDWNRLGGELILYPATGTKKQKSIKLTDDLTLTPKRRTSRSLGSVFLHATPELDVEATIKRFEKAPRKAARLDVDYKKNWSLLTDFGSRPFNVWIVLLVLGVFGIVVGPVNFWVLAPAGRRHRLFITTPLLSIATCSLLALVILVGDGIGGNGLRFTVVNLQPHASERRAFITQEQISRTGLLVRSAFTLEDPAVINPVVLPPSRWTRPEYSNSGADQASLTDQRYTGDWFRSRSEAGYVIQSTRPTRARIELVKTTSPDKPPSLFSSLGFTLDHLFYIDAKGKVWQSTAPVTTGQRIPLETTTHKILTNWWKTQTKPASKGLATSLEKLRKKRRNTFIAISSDNRAPTITTGDFIDWSNASTVVFGTPLTVDQPLVPDNTSPSPQDGLQ